MLKLGYVLELYDGNSLHSFQHASSDLVTKLLAFYNEDTIIIIIGKKSYGTFLYYKKVLHGFGCYIGV